ncbi:VOC family protein [Salinibacillus xinjiangensis]|uniref:VOC domain-containing protein n=1 Tax=Salinibacillus xinjiangensis TaxID=1229268 RepID=A0A6G1X549_9BACI|nr:VOC family protein [Salinibacillus xinjiangensis]MRG86049.1 hypothetical protein [Salinibacillus xinjiangensis]
MDIKSVVLHTAELLEMKRFYMNVLGFELVNEEEDRFRIAIGSSELEFTAKAANGNPTYHFAFNIPSNRFDEAKSWAKDRVSLNEEDGEDEAHFDFLSARALYFYDPAGNIVEFISRQKVSGKSAASFSISSILNIAEVSLVIDDVDGAGERLNKIGLTERNEEPIDSESLNFIGEGGAYILLTQPGRRWIFSDKQAVIQPLQITLANNHQMIINWDNKLEVY